jgi:antitoxin VapB
MPLERFRAKIFTNGGSQAVRLPKQLRVKSGEVEIWRDGNELRLRPVADDVTGSWNRLFAAIDRIGWDLTIADREQPPMPAARELFGADDKQ